MKKILSLFVVSLFLLGIFGTVNFGLVGAQGGYTGKKVLILKDVDAWGSKANENVLTEMGCPMM